VLDLIEDAPTDLFWPVFLAQWTICDNTWNEGERLLRALRKHTRGAKPVTYFSNKQRRAFNRLPATITVHRGCSRSRVAGVSWTIDEAVAAGFARGHRRIRVPDPVIASGQIGREHVFALVEDRQERELILDPEKVTDLILSPL